MRRRGAKVTDIVVLVVAADDGVMPQTVEAIDHAKAAEVPIVVAITKADRVGFKPEAIDRVKQQLSQHGILSEGWGGEVACFPVCSTGPQAGKGIDKLLDHLVLVAEVEDLKADPTRLAVGTVIEAENNPGRGVLATLLVEKGTLRRGDAVVTGGVWGRIRAMRDDKGKVLEEAPPGTPVEVTGLEDVPEVGKPFFSRTEVNEAREIADGVKARDREIELAQQAKPATLEGLFTAIEQGKVKTLKVILKTDVQGSLEAIKARLAAVGNDEVKIQVIRAGVGAVSESDVTMASTYTALIVGFHVVADEAARSKAKHLGVDIRMYRIIYELEQDLRGILEGKLSPEQRETILGHAEVLQVFRSTKLGNIAGCRVRDGLVRRDATARLSRNGIVVWEGKIASLRREKDDVREVKEGFECGIRLESFDDVKDGDVIEVFSVEEFARTLATTA
jgi:translation initiation factor IF-2